MPDFEIKATGEIIGYASLFGGPADSVNDVVAPGAFAVSLGAGLPAMMREHKGAEVGVWESAVEDDIGLKVVGTVTDPATLADLRAGRLDGLSIGYVATKASRDPAGRRVLEAVNLSEISIVKRPASNRARVLSVKSADGAAKGVNMDEKTGAAAETNAETTEIETKAVDITAVITEALKPLTDRISRLETVARRPGTVPAEVKSGEDAHAAFTNYLRHGLAGMQPLEVKAMRLGDDANAGYLASPEFLTEIDKTITEWSPIRPLATVRNTGKSEVITPKRTGRPTAQWVEEMEDTAETGMSYGQSKYPVKELAGFVDVSLQMLEDADIDIAAEIASEVAEELGRAEGEAFVTGTGIGRPMGFMSDTGLNYVAGGSATTVTADGLVSLYHGVKAGYRGNGTWVMNPDTLAVIRKLKTAGSGEYIHTMQSLSESPSGLILGRPVVEAVDMPAIAGGAFPIVFGDFKQGYRVFDRIGLSILRDDLTQRTKGKVRFHFRKRVAGGVRKTEALVKLKISN